MRIHLLSGAALLALISGGAANAQSVPPPVAQPSPAIPGDTTQPAASGGTTQNTVVAPSPQPAQGPTTTLGEVIVTAQRVTQNAQKAAVPIDVIGGAEIRAAGVSGVAQLTNLVPALDVASQGAYNYFFVRGVGNFSTVAFSDPAVAFNYDNVYVARPTSTAGVFYDLDRVEVLKGPQGTLYGRNATGGAINVLPTQPRLDGSFSGFASASLENYSGYDVQGAVNLPLNDKTAVRLSANIVDHGAYLRDGLDTQNTDAVRLQIKSALTPKLTVRVAADYAHDSGTGGSYSYVERYIYDPTLTSLPLGQRFDVVPSGIPLGDGAFTSASQAFRTSTRAGPAGRNFDPLLGSRYLDNDYYGVNGEIDYDTDLGTLTIIPEYRGTHLDDLGGVGFFVLQGETDAQTSVEARLAKTGLGIFDYNIGLYYFDEHVKGFAAVDQSALFNYQTFTNGTTSYAGFARLTAHLGDKLRLVAGFRYTEDTKRLSGHATSLTLVCVAPSCPTAPLFQQYPNLLAIPFAIPPQGAASGRGPSAGTILTRNDTIVDGSKSIGEPTFRTALEYDLTPRSLLYASVETGYRSGGFNLAAGYTTFNPEFITAYTIGSKNRFFGNRAQLNFEVFDWVYHDQQAPHVGIDLAGAQTLFTQNVGNATVRGAEVDGRFLVTPTTLLSGDVQYLDTHYNTFHYQAPTRSGPPFTTCTVSPSSSPTLYNVDCTGKPTSNSPKWTLNLAAQQTVELGESRLIFEADTRYRTSFYDGFEFAPYELVRATWRSNASVSYAPANSRWDITLFVRNIEDLRTPTFGSQNSIGGLAVVIPSDPRTYGVAVSTKF